MKRVLNASTLLFVFSLAASAGGITSIPYGSAYSDGLAFFFQPGQSPALSQGPVTTSYFTGVNFISNGTVSTLAEGCQGGIGAPPLGCPATRPLPNDVYTLGVTSTSASKTVNNGTDQEQYQGSSSASADGLDSTVSLNVSRGAGPANQSDYITSYAQSIVPYTVGATVADPAGSTGSLVLTYTISPPAISGTAGDPSSVIWYGEWTFHSWLPTNNNSTSGFQSGGVDLSTLTGPTQEQFTIPIVFGSATNVETGQQIGLGWVANTAGPSSANGTLDPLNSLTGIEVLGPNGSPVPSFTLTDNVGDTFGPSGLVAPEPSTWLLMAAGFLLLLAGSGTPILANPCLFSAARKFIHNTQIVHTPL